MPRRVPVIVLLVCVLVAAVSCGSGGGNASDDLGDLDAPIDSATVPCFRRLDLIVFVNPAVPSSKYDSIGAQLDAVPGVTAISLVDQEAAYDEILRLFAGSPGLGTINPSDLPASFRITLDDPSYADDVRAAAQTIDGVGQVVSAKDYPQPVDETIPC
jgi:hypothetical protein